MLAAIGIETGKATTWVNKTLKSENFITFMNKLVKECPAKRLCVVMENLNTHKGKMAQEWLERNPLMTFHYTPTHNPKAAETHPTTHSSKSSFFNLGAITI